MARILALALALLTSTPAGADTFADGLAAYDAGRYGEAAALWGELAEDGHAMAQLGLAGLYRFGQGVRHDMAAAARLYRLAAEQGIADAQINLAELYVRGAGVARDPVEAYAWLTLAASQGRAWAERRRGELAARMTQEDRIHAEQRAEELRAELTR